MRQALLELEEVLGEVDVFGERGREGVGAGECRGVRSAWGVGQAGEERRGGEDVGEVLFPGGRKD